MYEQPREEEEFMEEIDLVTDPSHVQRLHALRHGRAYSQSQRLLTVNIPLHMSVVTEGTPEDEQSSRNQGSYIKQGSLLLLSKQTSLDSTVVKKNTGGGSFQSLNSNEVFGVSPRDDSP